MRLSHRLVALHVAGVVILILVVLSSVVWVSAEHNKLALESSESMVRGGIASFRARLRTLVKDYSIWDEAYEAVITDDRDWLYSNIGNAAAEIGTLDLIVFVPAARRRRATAGATGSPAGGRSRSAAAGRCSSRSWRMLDAAERDNGALGTLLAEFEGEPWAFSIARVTPVDGAPAGVEPADAAAAGPRAAALARAARSDRAQPAGRRADARRRPGRGAGVDRAPRLRRAR